MNIPGELVSIIIAIVVGAAVFGMNVLDERRLKRELEAATDPADLLFSEPNPDTRSSTPETR